MIKELKLAYQIQKIVVSVIKMLIEKFLFPKAFFAISTPPFMTIYENFMLFLIAKYIIFRVKSAFSRKLVVFSFQKWCQILQKHTRSISVQREKEKHVLNISLNYGFDIYEYNKYKSNKFPNYYVYLIH